MNAHDFTLPTLTGGTLDLARYRGQPILIANTASQCGFTPQYAGLQRLWTEYHPKGLAVIGVPSNDFGRQEPGDAAEIATFCRVNYGVTFPISAKLHVAGAAAHPLFRYLAGQGGLLARPRWNFYKYLIAPDGTLATWFSTLTKPDSPRIRKAIAPYL